jgi:hypothetical protein
MDEQTEAARDALLNSIAESAGSTRLPRGLAQLAYASACVVSPGSAGAAPSDDEK